MLIDKIPLLKATHKLLLSIAKNQVRNSTLLECQQLHWLLVFLHTIQISHGKESFPLQSVAPSAVGTTQSGLCILLISLISIPSELGYLTTYKGDSTCLFTLYHH